MLDNFINPQFSKNLFVLLKPTDMCNLRCKYCFQKPKEYKATVLSEEILKKFCDITFSHYERITIVFHGGEPTLVGEEKIRKYINIIRSKQKDFMIKLKFAMQTNGTCLNDSFVRYLKSEQVGVGISFDGLHNDATRGQTKQVLDCLSLFKNNNFKVGVITVVCDKNCNDLIENYEYMKKEKINFQISAFENTISTSDIRLDVDNFIFRMGELFDYWCEDEKCNISVNPFEQIIMSIIKGYSTQCARSSCLKWWICLEPNGDVTPCDRIFPKEFCNGNIKDLYDIRQIYKSEGFLRLIKGSVARRQRCAEECDIYQYCEGGCNNQALYEVGLENNNGPSCKIFRNLFHKINKFLTETNISNIKNPRLKKILEEVRSAK